MNACPALAGRERSTPAGTPPATIREGEIHVWHGSLAAAPTPVSPAEAARAGRMRSPRRRHEFLVCRGVLRRILGTALGVDPLAVPIVEGEHGKPRLGPDRRLPPIGFNVSHSGSRFVVAVARGMAPGVDVERMRPRRSIAALARRFFSPAEREAVGADPDRLRAFYRVWSRKEAVIKADGRGVGLGLDRFDVSAGEPPVLCAARWAGAAPDEASRWSLASLEAGAGYAGAVAVRSPAITVVVRAEPVPGAGAQDVDAPVAAAAIRRGRSNPSAETGGSG